MSSPRQSLEIPSEEIQVVSEEKNTSTELNKHINSPDNNSHENTERITEEVGEFVVLQMPPQKGSKNSLRSSFTIEDSISPKKKRGSSNFSKGSWSHLVKPNDSTTKENQGSSTIKEGQENKELSIVERLLGKVSSGSVQLIDEDNEESTIDDPRRFPTRLQTLLAMCSQWMAGVSFATVMNQQTGLNTEPYDIGLTMVAVPATIFFGKEFLDRFSTQENPLAYFRKTAQGTTYSSAAGKLTLKNVAAFTVTLAAAIGVNYALQHYSDEIENSDHAGAKMIQVILGAPGLKEGTLGLLGWTIFGAAKLPIKCFVKEPVDIPELKPKTTSAQDSLHHVGERPLIATSVFGLLSAILSFMQQNDIVNAPQWKMIVPILVAAEALIRYMVKPQPLMRLVNQEIIDDYVQINQDDGYDPNHQFDDIVVPKHLVVQAAIVPVLCHGLSVFVGMGTSAVFNQIKIYTGEATYQTDTEALGEAFVIAVATTLSQQLFNKFLPPAATKISNLVGSFFNRHQSSQASFHIVDQDEGERQRLLIS